MKRKLLDQLAEGHDFPVPPSMVEAEFQQIWQQLEHEATHEDDPDAAKAEMEGERDDYRKIAERRVRLGLLLSEIGQANGVEVTSQEMNGLIAQAAQQYRGDDQQRFIQYVQQDAMAAAQLRAPLYEDKVVDFLFEKATVTDRESTREELEAAIESEEGSRRHAQPRSREPQAQGQGAKQGGSAEDDAADGDVAAPAEAETKPAAKAKKPAAKGGNAATETPPADDAAVSEDKPAKKPRAKKAAPVEAETVARSSPHRRRGRQGRHRPRPRQAQEAARGQKEDRGLIPLVMPVWFRHPRFRKTIVLRLARRWTPARRRGDGGTRH